MSPVSPRTRQASRGQAGRRSGVVIGAPPQRDVAEMVRAQIADGTLRPGDLAPSGEALSRVTGHARPTCRQALRALVDDGTLEPPDSIYGRPGVPGGQVRDRQDISPAAGVLSRRSRPGASRPG